MSDHCLNPGDHAYISCCICILMGADLCSIMGTARARPKPWWGGCGRGSPLPQWGLPENFGNFICQTVYFWEYLYDNWSTELVHFALLNTDVEAFEINFLNITLVRR